MQCYYSVVGMAKKGFAPKKIWLPGDKEVIEKLEGKGVEILDKEAAIKLYEKSGLQLPELLKIHFDKH